MKKKHLLVLMLLSLLLITMTLLGGCNKDGQDFPGKESFSFIYMGDPQADPDTGDYTAWGELLEKAGADESKPEFILLGGDLVNDGDDQDEWDRFFQSGGDVLKTLPVYPAMGNHDNTDLFLKQFDLPQNGPEGKKGRFYSFDYGDVHFIVMDSNMMGAANKEDVEWLRNDLSSTDKSFRIAMFHHPAYPAVDNPKDEMRAKTIRENFSPIFEEYGVNLVLNGHHHVYTRTYPMKEGKISPEGIVHLVGVSGGKQYSGVKKDYTAFLLGDEPVYSIITIEKDAITIRTHDRQGDLVDEHRIEKSSSDIYLEDDQKAMTIEVEKEGGKGTEYSLEELSQIPYIGYSSVYSTVNNWPSPILYSARGLKVKDILKEAGLYDDARTISFISSDGYKMSFLKEQLFETERYSFPGIMEASDDGSGLVEAILAYAYVEGSGDLQEVRQKKPCLIFGQSHMGEHTNPAFVEDVVKIVVSFHEPETWEEPGIFPDVDQIAKGESVKLQHQYLGLIKLYYTLDGSEPTELSTMYNPSTYQPELNLPIKVRENLTIKAKAIGYGKKDSPVATFDLTVID